MFYQQAEINEKERHEETKAKLDQLEKQVFELQNKIGQGLNVVLEDGRASLVEKFEEAIGLEEEHQPEPYPDHRHPSALPLEGPPSMGP
jgi:hypothetical protein